VADQVILNALEKDRTQAQRDLLKTPSDPKVQNRLSETKNKLRLYAATTLSRLAEVVHSREPLESRDKNQLYGVYLTALEGFLTGNGEQYHRVKNSAGPTTIQILPSDTLFGKLAASEKKRGYSLMASRPDLFHTDANSLSHTIIDTMRGITGLSVTDLLYQEKNSIQNLRSTAGKARQMEDNGGPAGSSY
jgi:hypothetical protein